MISEKRKTSELRPTIDQLSFQRDILNIAAEKNIPSKACYLLIQEAKYQSSVTETAGNFRAEFQRGKIYRKTQEICNGWKRVTTNL